MQHMLRVRKDETPLIYTSKGTPFPHINNLNKKTEHFHSTAENGEKKITVNSSSMIN